MIPSPPTKERLDEYAKGIDLVEKGELSKVDFLNQILEDSTSALAGLREDICMCEFKINKLSQSICRNCTKIDKWFEAVK